MGAMDATRNECVRYEKASQSKSSLSTVCVMRYCSALLSVSVLQDITAGMIYRAEAEDTTEGHVEQTAVLQI
jgi:hypothetical protein